MNARSITGRKLTMSKAAVLALMLAVMIVIVTVIIEGISTSITRVIVYCIFVYSIYRGLQEKSLFNPYFLFSPLPFSLLIYTAEVSRIYLQELTLSTWWFAIVNMLSFLVALNFTNGYRVNKRKQINSKKRLIYHAWILFFISLIPKIIPNFFLGSVVSLCFYPALVCALKSKSRWTIISIYIVFFVFSVNSLTKIMVLSVLITTMICLIKYYDFVAKRKVVLLIIIFFAGLVMLEMFDLKNYLQTGGTFISYIQGGYLDYSLSSYYINSGRISWNGLNDLAMPYMYFVTPWTNLQYVMETQTTQTYGLWLAKPFLGWLQIDGYFKDYYSLIPYSSFNTFTYLAVLYKDGGYWGSCLISIFLGFFVKRIYNRYIVSQSPLDVACYALIAQATLQMFFSNHFFSQSYPFTIVVIMAIYEFVLVKGEKVFVHTANTVNN